MIQVQCWPCSEGTDHCSSGNITECVHNYYNHPAAVDGPLRCISPLYTVHSIEVSSLAHHVMHKVRV